MKMAPAEEQITHNNIEIAPRIQFTIENVGLYTRQIQANQSMKTQ